MLEIKDIETLAKLARIELTEREKEAYLRDLGSILNYVDQIKGVVAKAAPTSEVGVPTRFRTGVGRELCNITREDEAEAEKPNRAEDIITEFPRQERSYLKVKKILEN